MGEDVLCFPREPPPGAWRERMDSASGPRKGGFQLREQGCERTYSRRSREFCTPARMRTTLARVLLKKNIRVRRRRTSEQTDADGEAAAETAACDGR